PRREVIGVSMALAAPVDLTTGTVGPTSVLRDWIHKRPGPDLGRRLQLPVEVDNDATLAGFGGAVAGAGPGSRHVAYVKLSTTIGCGIVIDGHPYGGAAGTAGELAHLVVDQSGTLCFCGNRGCLHTVVGGEPILADLQLAHGRRLRAAETARERE